MPDNLLVETLPATPLRIVWDLQIWLINKVLVEDGGMGRWDVIFLYVPN